MPNQPDTEKPVGPKIQALLKAIGGAEECRQVDPLGRVCWHCWDKVIAACGVVDPPTISVKY